MFRTIGEIVMIALLLGCCLAFLWCYTTKTDKFIFGEAKDCKIVMSGVSGTLCEGRDKQGDKFYYNKRIRIYVTK